MVTGITADRMLMQRTIDKQDLITHLLKFTATSILVIGKCTVFIVTISTCSYGNIAALCWRLLCGHADTGIVVKSSLANGHRRAIRQVYITRIVTRDFSGTGYCKMTHITICGFYVHTASVFSSSVTSDLATDHIKIPTHIHTTTICVRRIAPNCTTTHIESVDSGASNVHSAATAKSRIIASSFVIFNSATSHIENALRIDIHSTAIFTCVITYCSIVHIESAVLLHVHTAAYTYIVTICSKVFGFVPGDTAAIHIKGAVIHTYTCTRICCISSDAATVHIEGTLRHIYSSAIILFAITIRSVSDFSTVLTVAEGKCLPVPYYNTRIFSFHGDSMPI